MDWFLQEMVRMECERWARKGINITYQIRDDRRGYKAGALKAGMKHAYVRECEYVAIFDADFQPDPDFLKRTVPYLVHNPEIALVQARWRFGELLFFFFFASVPCTPPGLDLSFVSCFNFTAAVLFRALICRR